MTDRKAIAAAFRAAKPLLWDGRGSPGYFEPHEYICLALEATDADEWRQARSVIRVRIGGSQMRTIEEWLIDQGIPRKQMTPKRLQAHRHAWLDMLIAEFEGEDK